MAGYDQNFLNLVKEKYNLVDVASRYLTLEKKGGSYWACCPFHHEKTPSFSINESGQFYHCFGCGASGNLYKFVSEMESIDFVSTVKMLAERANVPLPQSDFDNKKAAAAKKKRDTVLRLMRDTAHFYLNNLNSGKAQEHIDYILNRKIPAPIVRAFGLGASLNYKGLPRYLRARGYSKEDMLDSGAVSEADGDLIDALGGRLIYPIINALGEVIAFGGRVLKKTSFGKYKNTKETIIFSKSKNLYNINLLKKLKRNQTIKEVIMVEGYMDTISLYQAGFKNVVASMGTSLTQDQARLIKRYTDTVLISYDGDGAGQAANIRGLDILKGEGLNVKVVPLPDGLDPDDVIKQRGTEGYRACLEAAMPLIDFKLLATKRKYDLTKPEEKRKYVSEAMKIIKTSESSTEQEDLLKKLRNETGISYESLSRDLDSTNAPEPPKKQAPPERHDNSDAIKKASRFIVASFLFGADYTRDLNACAYDYADDVHTILAKYVYVNRQYGESSGLSEVFEFFEKGTPEYEELNRIFDFSEGDKLKGLIAEKYFNDCVVKLQLASVDNQINALSAKLTAETDLNSRQRIAQEISTLVKKKEKIKNGVQ